MKIQPLGNRILVLPIKTDNHKTEANIELVNVQLATAEVIEFSSKFDGVYKKGDIILYHKEAGYSQSYNGKNHIFLNGEGATFGDVVAIIGNTKAKK